MHFLRASSDGCRSLPRPLPLPISATYGPPWTQVFRNEAISLNSPTIPQPPPFSFPCPLLFHRCRSATLHLSSFFSSSFTCESLRNDIDNDNAAAATATAAGCGDDDSDILIHDFCEKEQLVKAVDVLCGMAVTPSVSSCLACLKVCIKKRNSLQAKRIHSFLILDKHTILLNGIVADYLVLALAKCGFIDEAHELSIALPSRSVFSWTAIISGYAECGRGDEGLNIYQCMLKDGVEPNVYTFVSLCKACGSLRDLDRGLDMHSEGIMKAFTCDAYVYNTLVSMYGKCGAILEAECVFNGMYHRNIVSWTAMLSVYADQGLAEKALQLYRQMQEDGVRSELLAFGIALDACSTLAEKKKLYLFKGQHNTREMSLEIGRALHSDSRRKGYFSDNLVGNTLLTMYSKCGTIEEAENVFGAMPHHDVISWTAMISAYVQHTQPEKALSLYKEMLKRQICLNDITIISILQASGETGCLEMAKVLHFDIVSVGYGHIPLVATTLIYAYGSCASMVDAETVFEELSKPDIVSWTACIDGHVGEGNAMGTLQMFYKLCVEGMRPSNLTFNSVLLVCSHVGLISEGHVIFQSMSIYYGISPDLKQYGIMIDLLGRAGDFKRVEDMLHRLPMKAGLTIWLCLLRACHTHGNVDLAKEAFHNATQLQPNQPSTYILMSNICADSKRKKYLL